MLWKTAEVGLCSPNLNKYRRRQTKSHLLTTTYLQVRLQPIRQWHSKKLSLRSKSRTVITTPSKQVVKSSMLPLKKHLHLLRVLPISTSQHQLLRLKQSTWQMITSRFQNNWHLCASNWRHKFWSKVVKIMLDPLMLSWHSAVWKIWPISQVWSTIQTHSSHHLPSVPMKFLSQWQVAKLFSSFKTRVWQIMKRLKFKITKKSTSLDLNRLKSKPHPYWATILASMTREAITRSLWRTTWLTDSKFSTN